MAFEPTAPKLRHIAGNEHVSLHVNCTPGGGDVVVISGRAEVLSAAPPPSEINGMLDKYRDAITSMGYTQEWYDSYNTAIRVTPERAWAIPA